MIRYRSATVADLHGLPRYHECAKERRTIETNRTEVPHGNQKFLKPRLYSAPDRAAVPRYLKPKLHNKKTCLVGRQVNGVIPKNETKLSSPDRRGYPQARHENEQASR